MSLLLLVPALISLFLVLRGRVETAFLSVYLPCVLSLPDDYRLRIPHLPPTSAAEFALIPLGAVGLYRLIRSGSFALMDLLVPLYTASVGLSEILHTPVRNDGIFFAMNATIAIFLAYVAGRTLIEPDLRVATVRRFVLLILLDGIPGLYEWRMGQSLYGLFGQKVLGIQSVSARVQLRGGHGRMGSVFAGDAELGGIAFAMTICLNAWLVYLRRVKASVDLGEMMTKFEKYHVPGLVLLLYLLMTQSRGPMIALGAGYLILQIPRFKSTRTMTIVVAFLFIGGYVAMSAFFTAYTTVTEGTAMTEQQASAAYRRAMNELYPPIAEKGGWTGYSMAGIPHIGGMESIDNHYLLVHLAWGRLSYILFILIVWNNIRVLLVRSWQLIAVQDRAFIFSVSAAMAVLWITLLTVFLGGQLPQIAFLLMGWIQSTGQPRSTGFRFRRVFT
jgi:hypothetical protein